MMHRMCSHDPVLYVVGFLWRLINEIENILTIRFCFINFSNYVTQISTERYHVKINPRDKKTVLDPGLQIRVRN